MTDFDGEWFATTGVRYERADEFIEIIKTKGLPEDRAPYVRERHYPTDAGRCIRQRLFKMHGIPISNKPSMTDHLVWKTGTVLGDFLAECGVRAGLTLDIDLKAEEKTLFTVAPAKFPFSGRIDLPIKDPLFNTVILFWLGPANQPIPIEFKTIKQKGFDSKDGSDGGWPSIGAVDRPKKDHIMQVHHYMKYLGSPYGYVVYENKNDQRLVAHRVYWSDKVWEAIMDEALVAEAYYNAKVIPPIAACGHRGAIAFYQKRMYETVVVKTDKVNEHNEPVYEEQKVLVAEPGDINRNQLKFPCGYKGQDGGEGGVCEYLHFCHRDAIMANGSEKEKAKLAAFANIRFVEGDLTRELNKMRPTVADPAPLRGEA